MMLRRKLPIGIQTFHEIRESNCYYVDKTEFALRLIEQGKYYFLSRPRRFGKSLFLDTLAELFAANEPLFRGLHVHGCWDWGRRSPVIRLSFAGGVLRTRRELDEKIGELLTEIEEQSDVGSPHQSISGRFHNLIKGVHAQSGERVVVLVDEYDKPILDNLTDPDTACAMRDGLRNLYSVIKYEGYYASVFYAYFASLGLDITPEQSSNAGRLDMALRCNGQIYLFEFKVVELEPEGRALQQIKDRGYADRYGADGCPIHLIGVEFSREKRTVVGFETESLNPSRAVGKQRSERSDRSAS